MGDDEWDTEEVAGDRFNRANFQVIEASDEKPEIIRTEKNVYVGLHAPASVKIATQTHNQPPPVINVTPSRPPPPTAVPTPIVVRAPPPPLPVKPVAVVIEEDVEIEIDVEENERQEQIELVQAKQIKAVSVPVVQVPLNDSRKASRNVHVEGGERFKQQYSDEVIEFFSKMNEKSFTEQAVEYLNAYWDEVGDQAEFIFSVAHKIFTEADMHRQGITLFYKYEEGNNVDYPTYLYFYEKLCKFVNENPQWRSGEYQKSAVYEVKTAIKHKQELQEKVDVNFDGRISFLEYLLYQYNTFSNPAQFMERMKFAGDEHPAIIEARLALQKVNERIKAYEAEKARLEEGSKQPGVTGLTFTHLLAQLNSSPLAEQLNEALIKAEAAVRIAVKKFQGVVGGFNNGAAGYAPRGALWWMQRDLEEKKKYKRKM